MAGTLRLSNTGTGNGQSTITTAASGDTTYTLPSGGGTFVTTASTEALTVPFASGTAGSPSITFIGDTDTGIYSPGANQVAIATSGNTKLYVASDGKVGIGTTSPSERLYVNSSGAATNIVATSDISTSALASRILLGNSVSYARFSIGLKGGGGEEAYLGSEGNFPVYFQTNGTERARIDGSGRLLVGTSSAISAGSIGIHIKSTSASATNIQSWNEAASGTIYHAEFRDGASATSRGSITTNGSATAFNTSSDYRLKENVVPLTGAADRLKLIPVHRFNFIADPSKTVDGFIAHEAQAVVPECVTGEKDAVDDEGNPVYQGIDQSKLVPLLTAALQEALQKVEDLESRLTAAGL